MVLCFIALPIFAILGIFSLKYRKLAKDSLQCLFKTVTLRKCESGLDDRIRASITGKLMRFSTKGAGFVYRHYKLLSFLVLLLFIWSTYTGAVGVYNYYEYGNCNGPESTGFCILDPTGQNSGVSVCSDHEVDINKNVTYPKKDSTNPVIGNPDANLTIIEFGCYTCSYTKKAEPILKEVLEYYDGKVNTQFKSFPIPGHPLSAEAPLAADCALEQGRYKEYHDLLFSEQGALTYDLLVSNAEKIGLNKTQFKACLDSKKYQTEVDRDIKEGKDAGVYGTPTFFINDKIIVGPKPFKTFKNIIDGELK